MPFNALSAHVTRFAAMLALAAGVALASPEPYISEFMASNSATLRDEDQAFSDWIELYNPAAVPVDLTGWFLTDTASNMTRWRFPAVVLPPGEYLIVFASNKNRRDPGRELHTNFALAAEGEYLALVKPDGVTVVSEFAPEFPPQSRDVSYGVVLDGSGQLVPSYFPTPTPGAANVTTGAILLSEMVAFSRPPGAFTAPFALELSGAGPGQHVRYVAVPPSWAGAVVPEPTAASAMYTGPLAIHAPVIIRAAVFSDDLDTRGLSSAAHFFTVETGGPLSLANFSTHLPVLVIDQHGLSALAKPDGERPAWLYGYHAGGGAPVFAHPPDFAAPIIHKVRGHSSADFPKSSYNLDIINDQGRKSARALFGALEFDEWALVGPWLYDPALIRNSYVYALSNSIGRWAPRTEAVEVFVNAHGTALDASAYAGVYALTDKIEIARDRVNIARMPAGATNASEITGGYLLKIDFPDANEFSFTTAHLIETDTLSSVVVASPKADRLSAAQRDYIRGYVEDMEHALGADQASGWATRMHLDYIDRASWVDHHILNILSGNPDALERSAFFTKDRGGKLVAGPVWDFDRALGSLADGRSPWDAWHGVDAVQVWHFGWWGILATDPEFMQDWVDRWQGLRREQFADESLTALADELAAAVGPAAGARDAARWPENVSLHGSHAGEIAYLKSWLVQRAGWIDGHFVAPPAVSEAGAMLEVVPSAGAQLVYTLDGSDPRALGGDIAPNAIVASGRVLVPASSNLQARSYNEAMKDAFPGSAWSSAAGGYASTPLSPKSRLINISSRAVVGSGENALIAGVVVADTAGKQYLGRGIGPGLAAFGAMGTVPDPQLSIFSATGVELFRNNGWGNGSGAVDLPRIAGSVGAFPLPAGSNDSALAFTLAAGAYSVQITTPSGHPGVGLAELYEIDANGRTVNLSSRAYVGGGDGVLIGGFVVQGAAYKRMLIRAVGPTLRAFGVTNALLDPVLTIYAGATVIAWNERWYDDENTAVVAAAGTRVGAFNLAANSDDAALLITLAPGAYTVEVRGKDDSEGVALLEIYEVP